MSSRCKNLAWLVALLLPCSSHAFAIPPARVVATSSRPSVHFAATVEEAFGPDFTNPESSEEQQQQQQQQLALVVPQTSTTTTADEFASVANTVVVGGLAAGAAYVLLHEKIEALAALAYFGFGHGASEHLTLLSVAWELLNRLPLDALHAYEQLVPTNPVFYKACTSGVAYGLGDFLSQLYQGKTVETADLTRTLRSGVAGFVAHGPLCHYWLQLMEQYLDFGGAWWATGIKVTADLTVWSIFLNTAYSSIIGVLAGKPLEEVWRDVQATSWPALRSAWRFWPFVHTISFSHAVPMDLKLLWVDVMEVVWVTILSKVANEDKVATAQQQQQQAVPEETTAAAVDPSSSWQDVPRAALAAGWPLLAMWPVLFAGFQVEHALGLVQ